MRIINLLENNFNISIFICLYFIFIDVILEIIELIINEKTWFSLGFFFRTKTETESQQSEASDEELQHTLPPLPRSSQARRERHPHAGTQPLASRDVVQTLVMDVTDG